MALETPFTILVPPGRAEAIEERYAAAHSRMLLVRGTAVPVVEYDPSEPASVVSRRVSTDVVVVLTDPTLLAPPELATNLIRVLGRSSAEAVLPTTTESSEPAQRALPEETYLTLGQFEEEAARIERSDRAELQRVSWGAADPGVYATRVSILRSSGQPLVRLLDGMDVDLCGRLFAHRFTTMRGQLREDLLARIPLEAGNILEFGCGEGALAAALKARRECRVVGVELDTAASRIAETRLDRLVSGDVRTLLSSLGETFDFAIGGDIVEHLDDPWTFLARLRDVMKPEGKLLLSLPNIACWPIVQDVMNGRFDYVYIGITCVGHLRFFTRRSIEELLELSGWRVVSIEPQPEFRTPGYERFIERLRSAGIAHDEAALLAPGYYVIAGLGVRG
jgi:SAM-dependent methyltransferase